MWLIGALLFYVFYRLAFGWYFGLYFLNNPLQRPYAWRHVWWHLSIFFTSIILLAASSFFFYLSKPWLVVILIPLLIISFVAFSVKRGLRSEQIITTAVRIQVRMEKQGIKQPEINRAIALATINDHDPVRVDSDFKDFLKFCILSPVGLLETKDPEMLVNQSRDIDALVEKRTLIEKRRVAHT